MADPVQSTISPQVTLATAPVIALARSEAISTAASIKLLPWVGAGDFLVLLYAAAGLIFLRFVWKELQFRPGAKRWFIAGAVLAVTAVLMDSYDVSNMTKPVERLEQTAEEILETSALLCFLASFSLTASAIVQRMSARG
ncbi:hypothetical protein [Paenibacillus gansuensis]|uniref:Uncharacterized protein n=1 Tax=Paenibacillus gansuensis TaxID=306542 RepID=A0ABW5PLE0_9BACL